MGEPKPTGARGSGDTLRILVVDDDEDFGESMVDVLQTAGHEVELVLNGEQAVEMFHARSFDFCFMDLKLPGISGDEALARILDDRPGAHVVIMTAFTTDVRMRRAMGTGAADVLHKPFAVEEMLRALEGAAKRGVVLVVDDDQDFAMSLVDRLEHAGHRSELCPDAERAFERIEKGGVDVVLLDLRLPGRSGLDLFIDLKESRPQTFVVVITGFAREEVLTIDRMRSMSLDDVFTKPIDHDSLLRAIERLLA